MDTDTSNPSLFISNWPNGNILSPKFLQSLKERLIRLRSLFRDFLERLDPAVGFDLSWLLVRICEPTFRTIEYIAYQKPPVDPVDPDLAASTSALVSQLQAVLGDGETPDVPSLIPTLPNPEWDDIFRSFCSLLEASVDAYIIGDSRSYKIKLANAAEPHPVYRILREEIIDRLDRFPFLRPFHRRLARKLENSRSGVLYTQFWLKETTTNPNHELKRKTDAHDLDEPRKKHSGMDI
ncbi:hypothetical protein GGR58DRAFT_525233 [Xylaria digitata]|nr:hypothetical protein GGR58DRAFT_525233 [Xylaria digitata]